MPPDDVREPIAVVGIGCRFPGAAGPQRFWELLCEGVDAVGEVPPDRWDISGFYAADPSAAGRMNCRKGGFLDQIDRFDWRALRIPPREAGYLDPQHRLLLEVAWEAIEDAGLPLEAVAGSQTGVFTGLMWNDYLRRLSAHLGRLNGYALTGNLFAFAPNRISYFFDLKGPSLALDAACASSLASLHAACLSLWSGECEMALAGGVSLILHPDASVMLSQSGLLSPMGACRTMDAAADGFVRGEGAGVLALKPLSRLEASDRVYAFLRTVVLSHNGRNEWIMAASADGQSRALREAYRRCGVDPAQVDYVELHGTGLLKGDALEVGVVGDVLGRCKDRLRPCRVGSVKTNIGHLESAAGMAGVIKTALALHHGLLPPTLHLEKANPSIDFEALGLRPQLSLEPWPAKEGPALAGVSAIAMSGVNAHAVLEAAGGSARTSAWEVESAAAMEHLLPVSARTPGALFGQAAALADALLSGLGDVALRDLCFTAGMRRSHHEFRKAVVGRSRAELADALRRWLGAVHRAPAATGLDRCEAFGTGGRRAPQREESADRRSWLVSLARFYERGGSLDWGAVCPAGGHCVSLPPYSWDRERLWPDWLESVKAPAESSAAASAYVAPAVRSAADGPGALRFNGAVALDRSWLIGRISAHLAEILGFENDPPLDPRRRLFELGLNSLAAVELMHRLRQDLGRQFAPILVFDYPTLECLAGYMLRELSTPPEGSAGAGQRTAAPASVRTAAETIDRLADDEVETLLLRKLDTLEDNLKWS